MTSESQSLGDASGAMSAVGAFTEDVVNAFGKR